MARVVFLGTPQFACPTLEALHAEHNVIQVVTQPDRPVGRGLRLMPSDVKACALRLGLPVTHTIDALDADFFIVVAYGKILSDHVLSIPKKGCLNVHGSLLPRWRGAAPIQRAIEAGDTDIGLTIIQLVKKMDAGPMLGSVSIPMPTDATSGMMFEKLSHMAPKLLLDVLENMPPPVHQNEALVTYAHKIEKEESILNPAQSAKELERKVQAFDPWPGTSIMFRDQRLLIKKARAISGSWPLGIHADQDRVILGTSNGGLELLSIQKEGKQAQSQGLVRMLGFS